MAKSSYYLIFPLALLMLISGCQSGQPKGQAPVYSAEYLNQYLNRKSFAASSGINMPYRLALPDNYDPEKTYPLLVFLHGRGERGTDNTDKMFSGIGLFNNRHSILSPENRQRFPAIILVPQCSDFSNDQEWAHWIGNSPEQPFAGLGDDGSYHQHPQPSASGAAALELIDTTIANYSVDRSRVYITGISMGGFGTWEFSSRRPELFAAAVPMAGYSDLNTAERIKDIPFWIFHGDADEYNPVQGSRNMAGKLKMLGADVRYTELPGLRHVESFRVAWQDKDILPWLFSQSR